MVVFGFVVVLTTYAVINQYEAVRFLGARSEWDFKMAALVASVVSALCMWFNVSLGPMAHADFPDLEIVDQAYPLLIERYLPAGLVGLVVAGLLAAGYSTFDSTGLRGVGYPGRPRRVAAPHVVHQYMVGIPLEYPTPRYEHAGCIENH